MEPSCLKNCSSVNPDFLPDRLILNHSDTKIKTCVKTAKKICNFITSLAADLFLLPGALGLFLFAACYKSNFDPTIHEIKRDKIPILFIHGNGFNETQWVYGRHFLSKQENNGSLFSLNLDGLLTNESQKGIDDYAEKVATKVKTICKLTGSNEVILVGHSMGGLVASYYAENKTDQEININKVITISTPWHGSPFLKRITTLTQRFFPSLLKNPKRYQHMRNEDNFLDSLRKKAIESDTNSTRRYYSISCSTDFMVSGNNGALLENVERTKKFSWGGHYTVMISPVIWQQVQQWINEPLTPKFENFV
jgi:pimeloyl-ACP methyl ester carboxylesterase